MCCGLKKKPIPKKHPSICHKVKGCVWGAGEKGLRTKSELAASPPPPPGPTSGRECYITPAFLVIPKQRGTKSEVAASALPSWRPRSERK